MNGGYTGESSSLLPKVEGTISAIRGGGSDPKEINLFGTKITITDPSTGALTPEHETILSKLNFKDKDDTEKRNLLQAIYNEGCDTNATLDLKSGCSPMRGLVTALAMKLLENMSASTATATTVGEDNGVVISMTIPMDKLNIALGAKPGDEEVLGNPDTWCIAGDDVRIGMNNQLVEPLESIKRDLNTLKGQMQDNINKSIIYDTDVLEARYNRIIGGIDMLLADVTKIQGKICEAGGNAESTVSSTTWISRGPMGEEGNVARLENVADVNVSNLSSNEEIEQHIEEGGEESATAAALEGYEEGGEPTVIVSPEEQERINSANTAKTPVTPTTRRVPFIINNASSVASSENGLPTIPEENEENNTSTVTSQTTSVVNSNTESQPGSEVTEGGMYKKKRTLPNKTRRRVRFGDTPIIKLI